MAIFIESEAPDDMSLGTAIDEDDQVDAENDETIELGNGTVNVLAPGEKVNVAEKTPYQRALQTLRLLLLAT